MSDNTQLNTSADMALFRKRMKEIKEKHGVRRYKNFLLLNYLRALQLGDTEVYRYTQRKLKSAYRQLGFDANARTLDIQQCIAAIRQVSSNHPG